MRQEALEVYGVDLYPGSPVSAYRTDEQQAGLYQRFLDGVGEPANPPGTSSHEIGTAVDVPSPEMHAVIDEIGWKYGWGTVAPGEWWHVDYVGGVGTAGTRTPDSCTAAPVIASLDRRHGPLLRHPRPAGTGARAAALRARGRDLARARAAG